MTELLTVLGRIFHPSGGLVYHLRTQRRRDREWRPYRAELRRLLAELIPISTAAKTDLVLIGSSGAYTLETEFLKSFRSVTAIDWDPLAGFFLRRTHPGLIFRFLRRDFYCALRESDGDLARATGVEDASPEVMPLYFFNNLLGQLHADLSEQRLREVTASLKTIPRWVSTHDRMSARARLKVERLPAGPGRLSDLDIAETFFMEPAAADCPLEIESSGTLSFTPANVAYYAYVPWALKGNLVQWVELMSAGCSEP